MVEQSAVNRLAVGSNPTCGAMESCPSWPKEHDWKSCRLRKWSRGFKSLALRHSTFKIIYGPLVKWLRHRPFTAVSGVRIPYGSPIWRISSAGRALALQARGRRFEPCILHHLNIYTYIAGWSSLAARRAHNPEVAGSNPAPATNIILYILVR